MVIAERIGRGFGFGFGGRRSCLQKVVEETTKIVESLVKTKWKMLVKRLD